MQKTILLTGATDGIGLVTAKMLLAQGHQVLLHGRSADKLQRVEQQLAAEFSDATIEGFLADLSNLQAADELADAIARKHQKIDALINNAGVYKTPQTVTSQGLDSRFAVNTIAPYILTRKLLPLLGSQGRVINVSSAAQASVDIGALNGDKTLADMEAYSQSKLAITMWSRELASQPDSPVVIAVNPGSLLGSKMVKEGFGMEGGDLKIGATILTRLAVDDEFADASGKYFDNDAGNFGPPHADALDSGKSAAVVSAIEATIERLSA